MTCQFNPQPFLRHFACLMESYSLLSIGWSRSTQSITFIYNLQTHEVVWEQSAQVSEDNCVICRAPQFQKACGDALEVRIEPDGRHLALRRLVADCEITPTRLRNQNSYQTAIPQLIPTGDRVALPRDFMLNLVNAIPFVLSAHNPERPIPNRWLTLYGVHVYISNGTAIYTCISNDQVNQISHPYSEDWAANFRLDCVIPAKFAELLVELGKVDPTFDWSTGLTNLIYRRGNTRSDEQYFRGLVLTHAEESFQLQITTVFPKGFYSPPRSIFAELTALPNQIEINRKVLIDLLNPEYPIRGDFLQLSHFSSTPPQCEGKRFKHQEWERDMEGSKIDDPIPLLRSDVELEPLTLIASQMRTWLEVGSSLPGNSVLIEWGEYQNQPIIRLHDRQLARWDVLMVHYLYPEYPLDRV